MIELELLDAKGEANTGREDRQSEKAEINRRKRRILRESHGRVKKSEVREFPVNPSVPRCRKFLFVRESFEDRVVT